MCDDETASKFCAQCNKQKLSRFAVNNNFLLGTVVVFSSCDERGRTLLDRHAAAVFLLSQFWKKYRENLRVKVLIFYGNFYRQSQTPRMETRNDGEGEFTTEAIDEMTRLINKTRLQQQSEADIIRTKIEYHFMNPYQKYKARGRKPWKLLIQIFKIIIVTTQV